MLLLYQCKVHPLLCHTVCSWVLIFILCGFNSFMQGPKKTNKSKIVFLTYLMVTLATFATRLTYPVFEGAAKWPLEPLLRKSSSMSRAPESTDFDPISFASSSRIFFPIMMDFLVIFTPGLVMRNAQGSHCKNRRQTCI